MKTILYNPIFINPQAYYVFPRLTRWLRPDDSYKEPANYIGQIEVTIIAYGEIGYTEYFEHTNYIDLTNFSNSYVRISLFTRLGSCVLGEWKIGEMEGDRPYIEPEVLASLKAVVIVGDKTNQDKDRDIVANLVDASNPFIISNAAYKLNSGYGKYEEDFTSWIQTNGVIVSSDRVQNSILGRFLYFNTVDKKEDVPTFKVNIKLGEQSKLQYNYIKEDGTSTYLRYSESGIYTIPTSYFSKYTGGNAWFGFYQIEGTSTIEQIPSYQGAFVTDGVDDLITSTKTAAEMGVTDEITVVSMIGQLSTPNVNNYTNTIRNQPSTTGSYNKVEVSAIDKTGIYGYSFNSSLKCSIINDILGDKQDYSVSLTTQVENISAKYLVQGWIDINGLAVELSSVAWYWTIIANKVLTTDQINQVIAYYNLDRCVEPTVLYDVKRQGLSNDTPDSDWYLKDYSGNGYDMTLYNYAKTPESGINEDGGLQSDGVEDYGKVTGLPIYKDYTVVADYERFNIGNIEGIDTPPVLSKSYTAGQGSFIMNFIASTGNSIRSYSFGAENNRNFSDLARQIFYQSKYKSQGFDITAGTGIDGDSLWLGTARDNDSRFFNGAIYSLMSFPYSMSEFLIERQLKKYKLGTLYPNMVEFRPVIKSSVELASKPTFVIRGTSTFLNAGDYIPENSQIWIVITMNNAADRITKFVINGNTIDIPSSAYNPSTMKYGFPFTIDSKSPQKIGMTIEQDENYVQWNPTVESNVEYASINYLLRIPGQGTVPPVSGQYYPILSTDTSLVIYVATNGVDEVANLTINGQEPTSSSIHVDGRFKFEFPFNNSPQKINITIDEYIRFEDIVQPYPSLFTLIDYDTEEVYSWGSKLKLGARFKGDVVNLLPNMYEWQGNVLYNGEVLDWGIKPGVVAKEMVFSWNMPFKYLIDNNEPKVILSPRLLRIPNSSYKILGYIPDISGHGNHGKINNSAYAEGSGVNEDGSYQFDGVDDSVTIPTTVGGKQVLMKVNWQSSIGHGMLYDQRGTAFAIWNSDKYNDDDTDTIPAYSARNEGNTYIDGILNKNILASQLRNITHNIVATNTMLNGSSVSPTIGCRTEHDAYFTNMSLYDFMLFDEISTDDKILDLNEYVGIEGNTEWRKTE